MMQIVNPQDTLQRKNDKLEKIVTALMQRAEQKSSNQSGYAYAQFERAALLEAQVRERTADLERVLDLLNESNHQLGEANEATERAWSNLKEATDTIPDGIALFDSDDRVVLFNRQFCSELPDVGDRLGIGMTIHEYLDLVSQSACLDLSSFASRGAWVKWRLAHHAKQRVQFNLVCVDGRIMQIQSRRTTTGNTVVLHSDVTNTVRRERDRLIEQQVIQLRTTLDHLDQGVCIFDRTGRMVGRNSRLESLLDLTPAALPPGLTALSLIHKLRGQIAFSGAFRFAHLRKWIVSQNDRPPVEFEVTRGQRTILSVFCQEMADHGFLFSFRDVTTEREAGRMLAEMNETLERRVRERTNELDQALAAAERANASKSRFVAAASHDLAQPLSAAKLYVASLADDSNADHLSDIVNKAETALQSAEQIIEALLDISKFDSQRASFDRQPVPLRSVLAALESEMIQPAHAKGLGFEVVQSSLVVDSDPGYLRRIVRNFISNAVRYTDRGRVLVGVRRTGGMARLEVWDTGRGIDPAEHAVIFEEFRQLDNGTSETQGLGLGLAIVERACKALGHPLTLRSEPGRGSCFAIDLPIVGDTRSHPTHASASVQGQAQGQGPGLANKAITGVIVLLVVTDLQLSRALSNLIEGWGAVALEVTSSAEALSLLADVDLVPDVLILDGHLKDGLTGVDAYDAITARLGAVPTRIITADRSDNLQERCQDRQLEIMHKPIDPDELARFLNGIEP